MADIELSQKKKNHPLWFYYMALCFVILTWGTGPIINVYVYRFYTPTVCSALSGFAAAVSLVIICRKKLKLLNKDYLKIAVPTGIINSAASLVQKIGLQYTTPVRYAFLENLSCVVVPILMYVFVRKKPGAVKICAAVLCLVGCFVLAGGDMSDGGDFGAGELLCALSGILYGVNIAATGAFSKKLDAPLYVMIHMIVSFVTCSLTTVALNFICIGGVPIESIRFEWNVGLLLIIVVNALVSNTVCWTVRTNVMKHLDASVVAVMMPFSAVLTSILSVIFGMDVITPSLVGGALICFAAAILSGFSDNHEARRKILKEITEQNKNTEKSEIERSKF